VSRRQANPTLPQEQCLNVTFIVTFSMDLRIRSPNWLLGKGALHDILTFLRIFVTRIYCVAVWTDLNEPWRCFGRW